MNTARMRNGGAWKAKEIEYPESDGKPMAETDTHRSQMNYLVEALIIWFLRRRRVYVAGNNLVYYQQGDPRLRLSPDVYVVKGVEQRDRRVYKLWEEKKAPCVVIEVSSKGTRREDLVTKFRLYRDVLRVKEYYVFDPLREYLPGRLKAWGLRGGEYVERPIDGDRILSPELGLSLVDSKMLRLVEPRTNQELRTHREAEHDRQRAEAERDALRAELDRLRRRRR